MNESLYPRTERHESKNSVNINSLTNLWCGRLEKIFFILKTQNSSFFLQSIYAYANFYPIKYTIEFWVSLLL